jgi:hypothetical protein
MTSTAATSHLARTLHHEAHTASIGLSRASDDMYRAFRRYQRHQTASSYLTWIESRQSYAHYNERLLTVRTALANLG